jgi:hypothetical protein
MPFDNWVANRIVNELTPIFLDNIVNGMREFNNQCYPMPVRCRSKHWMKRGEERINLKALGFK